MEWQRKLRRETGRWVRDITEARDTVKRDLKGNLILPTLKVEVREYFWPSVFRGIFLAHVTIVMGPSWLKGKDKVYVLLCSLDLLKLTLKKRDIQSLATLLWFVNPANTVQRLRKSTAITQLLTITQSRMVNSKNYQYWSEMEASVLDKKSSTHPPTRVCYI